jgi:hypothetical protein
MKLRKQSIHSLLFHPLAVSNLMYVNLLLVLLYTVYYHTHLGDRKGIE